MKTANVDFSNIRSHKGARSGGFEELLVQLASLDPRPSGAVFFRKGPGADAGVECFLRNRDGTEVGWQAKYFFAFGTAQVRQLDESIEQALAKHPKLRRYAVGLPIDLKDSRVGKQQSELDRWNAWVAKWTRGRRLKIELWGASELLERLGRDGAHYSGRLRYWFDETALSPDWFRQRFEVASAGLGGRYTPELNIELPIRQALLAFCRDPSFLLSVEAWREKLDEFGYQVRQRLEKVPARQVPKAAQRRLANALQGLGRILGSTPLSPSDALPIGDIERLATEAQHAVSDCNQALWSVERKAGAEDQRYTIHLLERLSDTLENIRDDLTGTDKWRAANSRRLLIHGDAGVGKSHLLGDAAEYQIDRSKPALLVLGGALIEADPWSQIIDRVGLQGLTTDEFLGALDAAGQAAGTRAVILVDAINERHGIRIWPSRVAEFMKTIEPFPHVAIALSCRSTYLGFIFPAATQVDDLCRVEHRGFAGHPEAARYYLDKRGIVRMAAPNLVPEFENPLFLRTCCDFLERQGLKELPRGLRGVTSIFEFYTEAVARVVEERMELDPRQRIVTRALAELANACDQGDRGYVDVETAIRVLEGIYPSHGGRERSLLNQFESEGVVAVEPVTDDSGGMEEIARFTFERYSDHRIASRLLDRNLDAANPSAAFASGLPLHSYITSQDAYDRAGVIEALAIQLPERCGQELPDLVTEAASNRWLVAQAFRESVLWRDQSKFTKRTLELFRIHASIPKQDEMNGLLVAIATEPENPFNAFFLAEKLIALSMPERDALWSVFVARAGGYEDSHIQTLIVWTLQNGMEEIDGERAELAAIALCWLFSTSHRSVRDRATKALATLLARRLPLAQRLLKRFADVNDPYVLERLLGATYGAALQNLQPDGLSDLAKTVYDVIFASEHPIAHVLIRDHARGIIELAASLRRLPKGIRLARTRPPYVSAWPLEETPAELIESYRETSHKGQSFHDEIVSSTINDGDFARYVIDRSVDDWSDLPITFAGKNRDTVYAEWRDEFLAHHKRAAHRLVAVEAAGDALRQLGRRRSSTVLDLEWVLSNKPQRKKSDATQARERKVTDLERAFSTAERALLKLMTAEEKRTYDSRARAHVHRSLSWQRTSYFWPGRIDRASMRRWVCRRAHELGWSAEKFSDFDRHAGHGGRMEHQVERIGKKYQWIALHELVARLSDNLAYAGGFGEKELRVFQGPWQVNRRDMDPSLLAVATHEDGWRQWDWTWWLPASVSLKAMSPRARLSWLDSSDDMVNGPELVAVRHPRTQREWIVLRTFAAWRQWSVHEGDRHITRDSSTTVQCLLFRSQDLSTAIEALSGQDLLGRDLPSVEMAWGGYIGEYPWHPVYAAAERWIEASSWSGVPVPSQPTVVNYLAERSGHDHSIEDSFNFSLPAPGLIEGMQLHLVDGRKLSYADAKGAVVFYDPTTVEPGPGAALVDGEAFRSFLRQKKLTPLWIVTSEKNVYGGKSHSGSYGGTRSLTSLYWLGPQGLERRDHSARRDPTDEQLAKLLEGP